MDSLTASGRKLRDGRMKQHTINLRDSATAVVVLLMAVPTTKIILIKQLKVNTEVVANQMFYYCCSQPLNNH